VKPKVLTEADTSQKSEENSERVLEELGGSDTQEATRNKPISKDAAQELYGTRAAAA
jgi:hypothetical protein